VKIKDTFGSFGEEDFGVAAKLHFAAAGQRRKRPQNKHPHRLALKRSGTHWRSPKKHIERRIWLLSGRTLVQTLLFQHGFHVVGMQAVTQASELRMGWKHWRKSAIAVVVPWDGIMQDANSGDIGTGASA
jgi:hypothetical protein